METIEIVAKTIPSAKNIPMVIALIDSRIAYLKSIQNNRNEAGHFMKYQNKITELSDVRDEIILCFTKTPKN
jgi:hypothetical protein